MNGNAPGSAREPDTVARLRVRYMLVVVTTPASMLSVDGSKRNVRPLVEVTSTARIVPLASVTMRLMVPMVVPALFRTVSPVARFGRALAMTPRPRTAVVVVVVVELVFRTLFGLAFSMPVGEALVGP